MLATLAGCEAAAGGRIESWFAMCARGRAFDELVDAGGRAEPLGDVRVSRPATVWRARTRVRHLVLEHRIDVVICHAPWAYALFAPIARRARARVAWWQHDAATGRPWIERWARATTADLVIANSRWTARSAAALQPGVHVEVIHCPVLPPAAVTERARRAVRAALETDGDGTVILSAARLEPWKGHLRLLRALAALRDMPGWTLWMAGGVQRPHEATYLRMLRDEAAAAGIDHRVRWLGERRDMPAVIGSSDLLCQPNLTPEPFGIAFAEALLNAVPVVTTDMGGAPEIVDARCGRLVAAGDDAALVAALRELISDSGLRRRLGAAGPAHATSRCHPSVVMPRLADALARLTTTVAA
jgi:glycosyltransferase involved in cell wall biosynthesis